MDQDQPTAAEEAQIAEAELSNEDIAEPLTEQEALQQAEDDGIEFIDGYCITADDDPTGALLPEIYETAAKAKKAAADLDGEHHVIQTRHQKP